MAKPVTIRILGDASNLEKALGGAESKLSRFGSIAGGIGKVAGTAALGVGVAAAGGFVKGFGDAMGRDALESVIGADALGIASDLYRNAWGESLDDVGMLVADAQRIFTGSSDEQITGFTEVGLAIQQAYGVDATETLQTAAQLADEFGISNAAALDLIAESSEMLSGPLRDENMSALREYSGQFETLGFTAEEFFAVLATNDSPIVIDKLADSMKELLINTTDGSTATADTLAGLGLDAGVVSTMLLGTSDDARQATDDIVDALLSIEDPLEQQIAMVDLFGTAYEDTGLSAEEFLLKIDDIPGALEGAAGAGDRLSASLGDNLKTKLESLKRKGLDKLAEVIRAHVLPQVERLVGYIENNWPKISEAMMPVIDAVTEGVRMFADVLKGGEGDESFVAKFATYLRDVVWPLIVDIKDWIVEHWPQISATFSAVFGFIIEQVLPRVIEAIRFVAEVIGEVINYIVDHWPQISAVIRTVVDFVVDEVLPRIVATFEWIKEAVQVFIETFQRFWSAWGETITETVTTIFGHIKDFIAGTWDAIMGVFNIFKGLFTGDWGLMWDGIVGVVSGIGTRLRSTFLIAWEVFKLAFRAAWETLKIFVGTQFGLMVDGITALPGLMLNGLKAGGQKLIDAGSFLGNQIMGGLKAALEYVGQVVWDLLPGPVQWGLEHGASGVGWLANLNPWGGDEPTENKFGQAFVAEGTPGSYEDPQGNFLMGFGRSEDDRSSGMFRRGGGAGPQINITTNTNATPSEITDAVVWGLQVSGVN